ncbi:MAG TPA: response regulator transcription factor [Conexibacter sp.]|jgi:DNA-binding NarL/FixJ family response regulator
MPTPSPRSTELEPAGLARHPVVTVIDVSAPWARRATAILERHDPDAQVRWARSPEEAFDTPDRPPDVLLLSHRPGSASASTIRRIRRRSMGAAIVVAVVGLAENELGGLVAAGADGLVLDAELKSNLMLVVQSVLSGQISVPRRVRHAIEPPALSHREKQIVALVVSGRTNAEIARRLCLGESTVKSHLSSAFRRLGVSSRREAAATVLNDERLRRDVLMTLRRSPGAADGAAPGV